MPIRLLILSGLVEACALWTSNERTCIAAEIAAEPIYLMPSQLVPGGWKDVHKNSLGTFGYASEHQAPANLHS